ncbi:hypothetical protein BX257_3637 [Streptomyces sp. 3212.3]|nr:hypothetical protein BX257_3637 [Streptomyces sp. 3212.3]
MNVPLSARLTEQRKWPADPGSVGTGGPALQSSTPNAVSGRQCVHAATFWGRALRSSA